MHDQPSTRFPRLFAFCSHARRSRVHRGTYFVVPILVGCGLWSEDLPPSYVSSLHSLPEVARFLVLARVFWRVVLAEALRGLVKSLAKKHINITTLITGDTPTEGCL